MPVGIYKRVHPVRDEAFRREWSRLHPACQACGIPDELSKIVRWPGASVHHICKFRREDSATNLLKLCARDHALAEGATIRVDGVVLPTLSLAVCLSIKRERDPDEFDEARLAELFGRALPEPMPLPDFLRREFERWQR